MTALEGYDAARGRAALLERRGRGKIAVAGADRKTYLHAMLTNDIAALAPGTGCYAAYLTPQGRMITDLRVLELGDMTLLELRAEEAPVVLEKLDQFVFSEDVKLGDLTEAFAEVRVVGPAAAETVVAALAGEGVRPVGLPGREDLGEWSEFRNGRTSFGGETVVLVASRDLGLPGFDLLVAAPHAGALAAALRSAGAAPLSSEAAEALRIEAGRPLFGVDMDHDTIPLEAGIEGRAISFGKGCYPGQEVIVRVVHRGGGRVARRLVTLHLDGDRTPAPGATVQAAGRDVGRITSAAWSPANGKPLAFAYLQRAVAEAGVEVTVASDAGDTRGVVASV